MRRRERQDRSAEGELMLFVLDVSELLWPVLKVAVRIPVLLLRLLI